MNICFIMGFMTDILFAQLLIVSLSLPVLLRPFAGTFSQYQTKSDTFSVIPTILIIICILSIIAFSLDLSLLVLLIFCIILSFLNMNRFISFCMHMQKDYFSVFFRLFSLILLLILLGITSLFIFFKPAAIGKIEAEQTKTLYYGSPTRGFFTRKTLFDPVTAVKTECLPSAYSSSEDTVLSTILYIPDLFASTSDALEQMLLLAHKGYRVVSFDFYTSEITYLNSFLDKASFRTFAQRLYYNRNSAYFDENTIRFQENKEREISAALSILQSEEPTPVLLIAEGFTIEGAIKVQERYPQAITSVFIAKKEHALIPSGQQGMTQLIKTKTLELFVYGISNNNTEPDSIPASQRAHIFFTLPGEQK